MVLVKTYTIWTTWKENLVVTKSKLEAMYLKVLAMLNDPFLVQMVKVIQEQLKCQPSQEQK